MKIQIESSTACNAKCTFCPNEMITRPRGTMEDSLFRKIIKEGKEIKGSHYVPFLNGEPFIFPRIWRWLDHMRDENVRVHLFTNAEFMDVDRIITYPNIRLICCSINAATEETYNEVVRGPNFKTVTSKVEDLIRRAPFRVFVSMVINDENKHEQEMFRAHWGRRTCFGEFKNWAGDKHCSIERTVGERKPCWPLLHSLNILWDGRVVPCCMDFDGKVIVGDVNHQTLVEVWHAMYWMRKKHRRGDFSMEPCCRCNHNLL